ncbi:unnamed protein product [Heligmosomoides polygyrus]|uniref:AAA_11 domain-containing protein n=1 Tax=Heligmosomoides polygyrus TaxID=6339 RepID=A0A183FV81_HELPZ|nr:unnamed protein product [Heligmosomoides polygyrus]
MGSPSPRWSMDNGSICIPPDVSGSGGTSKRGAPTSRDSTNLLMVRRVPLSGRHASGPDSQQLGLPRWMRKAEQAPFQRNPSVLGGLRDATVYECADRQLREENTGCGVWSYTLVVCRRESAEHRANYPRRGWITISINRRLVTLTEDQRQALAIGTTSFPIVGIQAAFGTGKTVVGACIAARQARGGARIILTASTNAAVAQITETILSLDAFVDLDVCRYVAESVVFDDSIAATPADMHEVLKRLPDLYRDKLENKSWTNNRECQEFLTKQEREDLVLAERDVSDLIDKVVKIMFLKYQPQVVAITTSSLLNATGKGGIFKKYLDDFELIICDKASQVPELIFAAMLSRLSRARHIYIGDVYRLEPAHPLLNKLPNHFVYAGELRSGTAAEELHMLLNMCGSRASPYRLCSWTSAVVPGERLTLISTMRRQWSAPLW